MAKHYPSEKQILIVSNFTDLISVEFNGKTNAAFWKRELEGNFSEIANKLDNSDSLAEIKLEELHELKLSAKGEIARNIILNDFSSLKSQGASPVLNLIDHYEKDDIYPFFTTDVYSFHVDRSPVATNTFLCTYFGAPSEIVPNSEAIQKVLIPEIRQELRKLHNGPEDEFETFLSDHFFDLHYQPQSNANIINLGPGQMWKIAVDHPKSKSLPCIHRAPLEKNGQKRLLLIC